MPSAISPLITFKAGLCEVEGTGRPLKVYPRATKGYVYLYMDESELLKLCWRERTSELDEAELDLIMPPLDATFTPYKPDPNQATAKANGRFFVLKFESSSERHFFWMQSKPQRPEDPSWFSPRDLKIGDIVNRLLQGEEVDAAAELATVNTGGGSGGSQDEDDDGDETMEDVEGTRSQHDHSGGGGAGGAGADATGGDVRQEGESSREGGADGARAASSSAATNLNPDAAAAVRNFLASLQGNTALSGGQRGMADKPYPFLTHLLTPNMTVPMIDAAPEDYIDNLLGLLPPTIVVLATGVAEEDAAKEPSPEVAQAAIAGLALPEKRTLLKRVMRSPQFQQALAALTMAIRDGGLPGVAGALGIQVQNGGRLPGSGMPLGGGEAIEAFLEGVKKSVQEGGQ